MDRKLTIIVVVAMNCLCFGCIKSARTVGDNSLKINEKFAAYDIEFDRLQLIWLKNPTDDVSFIFDINGFIKKDGVYRVFDVDKRRFNKFTEILESKETIGGGLPEIGLYIFLFVGYNNEKPVFMFFPNIAGGEFGFSGKHIQPISIKGKKEFLYFAATVLSCESGSIALSDISIPKSWLKEYLLDESVEDEQ